jgi:type I restriction enzyme, S subunit
LKGDILFAKIRPYFHKVGFALTDGITPSDTVVVRAPKPEWQTYVLHLLSSDSFIALTSKTVKEGAKMPRADWKFLLKRTFSFPPSTLRERFNDYANPLLQQLCSLGFQNRKLSEARDLLLPRLMDGRIEV